MHSQEPTVVFDPPPAAATPQPSRRGFVDGPHGQMFYRSQGQGTPIVMVHQILRTSLDYRFVMPRLATRHRVIALDNPGCGLSDPPARALSLPEHAAALAAALDALDVRHALVVGHHSGANVALELALQRPGIARALVLSGLFYVDDAARLAELHAKAVQLRDPEPRADGAHLMSLWNEGLMTNWGKPRLPADRLDLLGDFFLEQYGNPRRYEPYVAQMHYDTSTRLPLLRAPCRFVSASDDIWMCCNTDAWRRDLPGADFVRIDTAQGGELPRLHPDRWSETILEFALKTIDAGAAA
jgi:pimeloyl-ACP methyl ester carboxylesterase